MIIELTNRLKLKDVSVVAYPHLHGLKFITSATAYNGYTYEVIDEKLFFLKVIQHGIEFIEIK
jgi:hypothetical protein